MIFSVTGVVEIVSNAETLCKIQADYGVTGAFRNRPISGM